ncbi:MAG: hypothetical protein H7Y31_11160, partial [Chitinophagaceae bacterium]|nr:hypothetical protein [Chitinophagaceae bacterium]
FATIQLIAIAVFSVFWLFNGYPILDIKHIVLYKTPLFEFFIDFYFDAATAVFAFVGGLILLLVALFSKFYLHRDEGYKRFFCTMLLFYTGYNLVIFSGNFETLFIGWEILGFCSFLLIAFYRDRYLPVKNGLKVLSIYRLGDVCLIIAMWICHHLFHQNITFLQLSDANLLGTTESEHPYLFVLAALMIFLAAAAKSALLPFSSWLSRAMEGPTTSSAVFYGSLSIHLGAFLLIRTYPFWDGILAIKIIIIATGIVTSLIATAIARVQSTVKTQIAYASIAQIGLITIEIAVGFHTLALIHFAGNALLRTYQLLVSPSVLSYKMHDMFFNFVPGSRKTNASSRFRNAIYVLSIKEWNLDFMLFQYLWSPFKWFGRNMSFLVKRASVVAISAVFLAGIFGFIGGDVLPAKFNQPLAILFSVIALLLILTAFAERGDARRAWILVVAGQAFVALSIAFNDNGSMQSLLLFLSGIAVSAIAGFVCLTQIKKFENDISLNLFHGYTRDKPWLSFVFLLACLGLIGFPFTPTFIGIDLLFTHIHSDQPVLIVLTTLSFIFIELSIIRIYARIFLGPNKKMNHPIAYRSS